MSQQVYIVKDSQTEYVADKISKSACIHRKFTCEDFEITGQLLFEMAKLCPTEFFYVIKTDKEIVFDNFDFSFKPPVWDKEYVHIWNNATAVRLYNKELVLANPNNFSDKQLSSGLVPLKNIDSVIYSYPIFDIVFIGYDESYVTENYNRLKLRFPRAKQVLGVKGIYEAHKAAANLVNSDMFYVVDADAEIMPDFRFNHQPNSLDRESVHVWYSKNPVNDLEYGYGGVKLFPTKKLLNYTGSPVDFTTSVSSSIKVIPEVSNITNFNTDPFSTWRSAFRECVKLSTKVIQNQDDVETEHRLNVWCSMGGDREFGEFAIMGANEGRQFGLKNINQPEILGLINNFTWLEERFSSS